jgi:hypothetical protein
MYKKKEIPWAYVRDYMLEVCYQNRFTNFWDKRIYKVYVDDIFSDEIFTTFHQPLSESSIYYMPRDGTYQNYIEFIGSFPRTDDSLAFGLHPNANIKYSEAKSKLSLGNLRCLRFEKASQIDVNHDQVSICLPSLRNSAPFPRPQKKNKNNQQCSIIVASVKQQYNDRSAYFTQTITSNCFPLLATRLIKSLAKPYQHFPLRLISRMRSELLE